MWQHDLYQMHILKYFSLGYVRMQQIFFYHYTSKMYNKSRLIVTLKHFKRKTGSDFINATALNICWRTFDAVSILNVYEAALTLQNPYWPYLADCRGPYKPYPASKGMKMF